MHTAYKNEADILDDLMLRHPSLSGCAGDIRAAVDALADCFLRGGRLYICGNGGSAADALHIVGELMKSFVLPRPMDEAFAARLTGLFPDEAAYLLSGLEAGLPAFALVENASLSTAFANDAEPALIYAQQVAAAGRPGDALLCISTSGNALNCAYAAMTAKAAGMNVLSLTGEGGGRLAALSDVCVRVPERETFKIQELHLPVYHALCLLLEQRFFGVAK